MCPGICAVTQVNISAAIFETVTSARRSLIPFHIQYIYAYAAGYFASAELEGIFISGHLSENVEFPANE